MKHKSVIFFNFGSRFLKMYIFEIATFFLAKHLSNQPFFSLKVIIYKIYVFDEAFFLLATAALITVFFLFPCQPLLGKQTISSQSCSLSIQTISEKMVLTLSAPAQQNGQTHSNSSSVMKSLTLKTYK